MLDRRILPSLSAALACAFIHGCGGGSKPAEAPTASIAGPAANPEANSKPAATLATPASIDAAPTAPRPAREMHPEVLIKTSLGDIKIRLDVEKSPRTVDNFLDHYVSRGFYNGTMFHYVEKGFMIIGGGYTPDGEPKETRTPVHNEAHNGLKNLRGTVAMARHAKYVDSATSQFFINLADNPTLDHVATGGDDGYGYCVFGQVIEGMEVVDRIANVAVKDSETFPKKPVDPVTVESAARLK